MSDDDFTPPRGEAAWNAAKREVAKRNEAAYAKARKERSSREAAARAREAAAERREFANLPRQPKAPRAND
jgi:hypothetical protein